MTIENPIYNPLELLSDRELIDTLNERGYAVIKKDRIGTASSIQEYDKDTLLRYGEQQGFMNSVYQQLGASLGAFLMENGAIRVSKEATGIVKVHYRAEITILADRVDQSQSPMPWRLKL